MPGWTPILNRSRFTLTGTDRTRYLNGQVTNQVEGLPADAVRYACVTNRKGQLEADLFITAWPDRQWLMLESADAIQDELFTRLDRYIIADDAELVDVTSDWQTFHILTEDSSTVPLPAAPYHRATNGLRLGLPGIDITLETQHVPAYQQALTDSLGPPQSQDWLEYQRIVHAIPKWGAELNSGLLPPEARLESYAIDYAKGCYTGQEVISRIKSVGKVNRLLTLFNVDQSKGLPAPGDAIFSHNNPTPIGTITSVAAPLTDQEDHLECLALGYLKSQHASQGQAFTTRSKDGSRTSAITSQPFPKHDS